MTDNDLRAQREAGDAAAIAQSAEQRRATIAATQAAIRRAERPPAEGEAAATQITAGIDTVLRETMGLLPWVRQVGLGQVVKVFKSDGYCTVAMAGDPPNAQATRHVRIGAGTPKVGKTYPVYQPFALPPEPTALLPGPVPAGDPFLHAPGQLWLYYAHLGSIYRVPWPPDNADAVPEKIIDHARPGIEENYFLGIDGQGGLWIAWSDYDAAQIGGGHGVAKWYPTYLYSWDAYGTGAARGRILLPFYDGMVFPRGVNAAPGHAGLIGYNETGSGVGAVEHFDEYETAVNHQRTPPGPDVYKYDTVLEFRVSSDGYTWARLPTPILTEQQWQAEERTLFVSDGKGGIKGVTLTTWADPVLSYFPEKTWDNSYHVWTNPVSGEQQVAIGVYKHEADRTTNTYLIFNTGSAIYLAPGVGAPNGTLDAAGPDALGQGRAIATDGNGHLSRCLHTPSGWETISLALAPETGTQTAVIGQDWTMTQLLGRDRDRHWWYSEDTGETWTRAKWQAPETPLPYIAPLYIVEAP